MSDTIYMLELYSPSWSVNEWIGYSHSANRGAMLKELEKAKQSYKDARLVEYRRVAIVEDE